MYVTYVIKSGQKKSMGWLHTEEGKLRTIRLMLSNLLFPSYFFPQSLLEFPALMSLLQTCCSFPRDPSPPHQPHQSCRRLGGLLAHRESEH